MSTITSTPGGTETLTNFACITALAPLSATSVTSSATLATEVQLGIASNAKVSGGMSITTGASGSIKVPYAGVYFCSWHIYRTTAVASSYDQQASVYVNGSGSDSLRVMATFDASLKHMEGAGLLWLAANDTVAVRLAQSSGSTLSYNGAGSYGQSSATNNINSGWLALSYIGN